MYDVVIVGYGPTGMLAAVKLGRAGHKVAVLERYKTLYSLPRVGIVHDDVLRMFQEIGIVEKIKPATHFLPTYEMSNKGKILLSNNVRAQRDARLAGIHFDLSAGVRSRTRCPRQEPAERRCAARPDRGRDRAGRRQGRRHRRRTRAARAREVEGRYLIGADGGNSFVRSALGLKFEFLGFDQDWLVIDAKMKRSPRPDLPALRQFCEPDQPGMTMQMGAHHRRWSFMIFPGRADRSRR